MLQTILTVCAILLTYGFAAFTALNPRKRPESWPFAFATAFFGTVNLVIVGMQFFPDLATLFNRVAVFSATLGFTTALQFGLSFPGNPYNLRLRTLLLLMFPGGILATLGLVTDLVTRSARLVDGKLVREPGILYTCYVLYMGVVFLAFLSNTIFKLVRFKNPYIKLQVRYEIFGIGIGMGIAVTGSVILPALKIGAYYAISAALGATICCGIFYYASQANQLMDFSAFFRRGIFYMLLALLLVVPTILVANFLTPLSSNWPQNVRLFALVIAMVLFYLYARLILNILHGFIERREQRMKFEVERFTSELESTQEKREMARRTIDFLLRLLKLEHAEFLVYQEENRTFDLIAMSNPEDLEQQLSIGDTLGKHSHDWLFKIFMLVDEIIYRDTLQTGALRAPLDAEDISFISEFMQNGRFYLLVPLKFNSRLLGCVVLGRKTERKPFTSGELGALQSVRQELAVALSNVLMYSSLLEKVNEMNTLNKLAIENQDKHTRATVIEMICEVLLARLPFERISFFNVEFVQQALTMQFSTSKNIFMPALHKRVMIKLSDGPVGTMVLRNTELCVNYLHRVARSERSEIERWLDCNCYAMIPIAHSGVPVGILVLENFDQKAEIKRDSMRYLSLLAQHIGNLLERFEMYHDIKSQLASLKIVTEAAYAMGGSLDIDKVTREILQILKKTYDFQQTGVFFYNSGHDILHKGIAIASNDHDSRVFARLRFHGSDESNPFQEALRERKPIIFENIEGIKHPLIRRAAKRWGKGLGIFPITVRNSAIAVLVLSFDTKVRKFSSEIQSVISSLTQFYATALENARSYTKVETINANLEKLVEDRTHEAESERKKSDALLLNILPREIAEDLKISGESKPTYYADVTVLFTDFVGFTQIAEAMSAEELVDELNICFRAFDAICERHNLEKLKTIGDAYMAAGGLPIPNTSHPDNVVAAALEIVEFMDGLRRKKLAQGKPFWELRCGVHTGPVIAGVIGSKKFAYDIWGDTVNMASRMESSGVKGRVNISAATFDRVKANYDCEYRGEIEAKRKGKVQMYLVAAAGTEAISA